MGPKRENFSRKRAAILEALREARHHPTAEWIYHRLKPEYPDLSLGTVYRNLNRFQKSGQAVSLGVIGGHERFDGDTVSHAHLVCARCGAVMDVPVPVPAGDQLADLSRETGCRMESVAVTFRGLCPDCLGKESKHGA